MLGVVIVYLGIIAVFAGAISLLKPLSMLGIRTRRRAALLVALGLLLAIAGAVLPADERTVSREGETGSKGAGVLPRSPAAAATWRFSKCRCSAGRGRKRRSTAYGRAAFGVSFDSFSRQAAASTVLPCES